MAKVQPDETKDRQSGDSDSRTNTANASFNLGGVLGGLGGLIGKLGELAEAGEKLSQSGEFKDASGKLSGVYGIHVKSGLGEQGKEELKVEPFGSVRPKTTESSLQEDTREPLVDIHDEDDHLLVLAELPGVDKDDVTLEMVENRLKLSARRGNIKYQKEIMLPQPFSAEELDWDCKNGILQIRLRR